MANARQRLDRFISVQTGIPKGQVRQLLAQQRIRVDDVIAQDISQPLDSFSRVMFDGVVLQNRTRRYVLLNKPVGVVSATKDDTHRTVIDVLRDGGLPESELNDLHIAGRLDLNSSGLLLLTNDSEWSQALMAPDKKVAKVYEVTLENPISDECIAAFKEGIYFPFEDITTKPSDMLYEGAPVRAMNTHLHLNSKHFLCEGELYLFATVINEFLSLYTSMNSFNQLNVTSTDGGDYSWQPRMGQQPLI